MNCDKIIKIRGANNELLLTRLFTGKTHICFAESWETSMKLWVNGCALDLVHNEKAARRDRVNKIYLRRGYSEHIFFAHSIALQPVLREGRSSAPQIAFDIYAARWRTDYCSCAKRFSMS